MTQTVFSAGRMFAAGVDTGSEEFGFLQNISIDFTRDVKELFGERQFPDVVATGMSRVTGRAAHGRIFGSLYASAFFGEDVVAGSVAFADNEVHSISDPGYNAVDVTHDADWTDDLGVYYADTGLRLTWVDAAPTAGQYSVASGTYTFSHADAGKDVKINYLYDDSTHGKMFTINNQLMGITPAFKLVLFNPGRTQRGAAPSVLVLNNVTATKLTLPMRLGEFALPEFDFTGYADASDVLGTFSTQE